MKLLITGAAGFVASSLIDYFNRSNKNIEITGIDNFSYGYPERLINLDFKFIKISIEEFTESNKYDDSYDAIIHCAAIAPLPENEINPARSYENNLVNTIRMADYSSRNGCKKFIFFSSGAIYENDTKFPSKEDEYHNTTLVYPTSKMCAEISLRAFSQSYNLKTFSLRLFNLYGPRQDYFRKQPPLIGYVIKCLINNEEATLFSSGEQMRDYIYISDVYQIILKLLKYDLKDNFLPLNLGTGKVYSVNEIVNMLCKIAKKELKINRLESAKYWDKYPSLFNRNLPLSKKLIDKEVTKYSEADLVKFKNLLSYTPNVDLEEGLRECYEYAINFFK